MNTKSIALSSNGLKNIVLNETNDNDDFNFIFGNSEIKIKKIFAEFISPLVSNIHRSDPTNNSIQLTEYLNKCNNEQIITEDVIYLFKQISSGFSIQINEEQSLKLRLLSLIIGNDELFSKIAEAYPYNINEENISFYLQYLVNYYNISKHINQFDFSSIIDSISSLFYSIDKSQLLNVPKYILYLIISNNNLLITNEDSLLDFINEFFSKNQKEDEIDINSFYECVNFHYLSNDKFQEFIKTFNYSEMTKEIWEKVCKCFTSNSQDKYQTKERYLSTTCLFNFDGNSENAFKGIIYELTNECGGNVNEKGVVKTTSSSIYSDRIPKIAVDFNDIDHFFQSSDVPNSWLKYDFIERRIHPTHYSIRSRNEGPSYFHPKNWVIEGSNTNDDDDWMVLDSRQNETCLDGASFVHTFKINYKSDEDLFFKYLRIRQTGPESNGSHYLTICSLEYFGYIFQTK